MLKGKILIALTVAALTAGCSTGYQVRFDSTPQGASLICNGTNWGYTPKTLYYDKSVKSQPYIDVSNCSAVWSSGVNAAYPAYLQVFPSGATNITLPRPDAPGYAQDAEFALKVQQLNVQQQQSQSMPQPTNTQQTTSCRKIGDLSGQVYQFAYGYCPVGYY